MIFRISVLFSLLLSSVSIDAQELQAEVRVNTPQLQTADPEIFSSLEGDVNDFLNNTDWTDDEFEPFERIKCNVQLTIKEELSDNTYRADLAIQSTRPVYGSNYETPVFSYLDQGVTFSYEQYTPLEYGTTQFNDNLSSVLCFYAYIILALDYDSYEQKGGDRFLERAQEIINAIPPNVADKVGGWRPNDSDRNRYWILDNLLSPTFSPLREAYYQYHRKGLDNMFQNTEKGKEQILSSLKKIDKVNRSKPSSMMVQLFATAKRDEIIEIFKKAPRNMQVNVYQIMATIDASNISEYAILKS